MRVNVQQWEMIRLLEKLGVLTIEYCDEAFSSDGTSFIEIKVKV